MTRIPVNKTAAFSGYKESAAPKKDASLYTYRVVRENVATGERGKRTKTIDRYEPLKIGGLYAHLGKGFPGFQRILELVSVEEF